MPLIAWKEGIPSDTTDAIQAANDVWGEYTKYAGVSVLHHRLTKDEDSIDYVERSVR